MADDSSPVDAGQVRLLIEQNRRLQDEITAQEHTIEQLRARMDAIEQGGTKSQQEPQTLQDQVAANPAPADAKPADAPQRNIQISAEMGFAFFDSGSDGPYSNGEFRIDDAKVFLDAQVWKDLFFHAELDLQTREAIDDNFHLGEIYAELEEPDGKFNLRIGRMYIPFGEEYQVRGVMEDPLISHSVSDIWGMDEGIEAYGQLKKWSYYVAVQDGGINQLENHQTDKSVAARVGFEPAGWLNLSASAMRTGHLNNANDGVSALWFANGFFRALGPTPTTETFWANLAELDAAAYWRDGHVKAAAGVVQFDDSNTAAGDARRLSYYYLEAKQAIADPLYGALRFSQVHAPGGYPLVGQGTAADYFFSNVLTTDLYRFSAGLGYAFTSSVLLKIEFSPEWGSTTTGEDRDEENLFSTELALKF